MHIKVWEPLLWPNDLKHSGSVCKTLPPARWTQQALSTVDPSNSPCSDSTLTKQPSDYELAPCTYLLTGKEGNDPTLSIPMTMISHCQLRRCLELWLVSLHLWDNDPQLFDPLESPEELLKIIKAGHNLDQRNQNLWWCDPNITILKALQVLLWCTHSQCADETQYWTWRGWGPGLTLFTEIMNISLWDLGVDSQPVSLFWKWKIHYAGNPIDQFPERLCIVLCNVNLNYLC